LIPLQQNFSKVTQPIKISAVSYLNTKPLLYGIERARFSYPVELSVAYPSLIAEQLQEGTVDIGLVPVAAIPSIPNARIISDYGIAGVGKVTSVSIFSDCPMEDIESVYLDYQSRTSVNLAKVLLKHYWKKTVRFLPAPEDYIDRIGGRTAGVIIGDRALINKKRFAYDYDLSEHWQKMTGLPFIFAAWVANKEIPADFCREFDEANAVGLEHLPEIIAQNSFPAYDLNQYYKESIHFQLNEKMKKGLALFLDFLKDS